MITIQEIYIHSGQLNTYLDVPYAETIKQGQIDSINGNDGPEQRSNELY